MFGLNFYASRYRPGRGKDEYNTLIEARDYDEALQIAQLRGLDEAVSHWAFCPDNSGSNHRLIALIKAHRWTDAAHEASFLCFVGLKSGTVTPEECLGDQGLVHELVHLATIYSSDPPPPEAKLARRRVMRLAKRIEKKVPGHVGSITDPRLLRAP
jgi:hypothetical protein